MTPVATPSSEKRNFAWLLVALLLPLLGLAVFGIIYLALDVHKEIDALAIANTDNTQWSLSQAEVDLMSLRYAVLEAERDPDSDLNSVRRRFDIFFSRMAIIRQSELYEPLRQSGDVAKDIVAIQDVLDDHLTVIDGEAESLRASLPQLMVDFAEMGPVVRRIGLQGIQTYAMDADGHRKVIADTLSRLVALIVTLIVALLCSVLVLLRLLHTGRLQRTEQISTQSRLESMIKTSLDAILVVDGKGHVLDFNGAAERVFGYTNEEAVGRRMEELIVPDHLRGAHNAGMKRYQDTGQRKVIGKGRVFLEAKRKDGSVFPVELSISTAKNEQGEIFVSYIRDISARIEAEKELVAARDKAIINEKAKADLLVVMSHEMRTPLNGILGTLELLNVTELTDRQRRYIEIIGTSGKVLLHHVNDVLDASRLDAGELKIADQAFNVNNLIVEIAESQRGSALAKRNELLVNASDPSLDFVRGDPMRIRQMLLNLLGNAIKFTRDGHISIEAERLSDGRMVEFRVSDTGAGINEQDMVRIFEDFVTVDASYQRSETGTGLGLGIVRRLSTAMGGQVGVESELGEGSLFWVRIPLAAAANQEPGVQSDPRDLPADSPADSLRILVIEDNPINRFVAREMLEHDGHFVREAINGREGVRIATAEVFDLIFMDISMPEMDGLAATNVIRAEGGINHLTPIVAQTAHASPVDIERFRAAGMRGPLLKPLSRQSMRHAINSAFTGPYTAPPETSEPELLPLIDEAVFTDLKSELAAGKVETLLHLFLADTAECLGGLRTAFGDGQDGKNIVSQLHRVAGSSGLFGAARFRAALVSFEVDILGGSNPDLGERIDQLHAIWDETHQVFVDLQAGFKGE